jgi:hypothetical protein
VEGRQRRQGGGRGGGVETRAKFGSLTAPESKWKIFAMSRLPSHIYRRAFFSVNPFNFKK